jgi:hypothetical protein
VIADIYEAALAASCFSVLFAGLACLLTQWEEVGCARGELRPVAPREIS